MSHQCTCPSLSVVVNNHNYGRFLGEALDSALSQLVAGDELLVVDDGSSDHSLRVLEHYAANHGVRFVSQPNRGQMHAVRTGIANARCDVIVLLDSDDYFLPGYLRRLRAIYRDNPEVSFVFCRPHVGGPPSASLDATRDTLRRMELPHGIVGRTRWATLLFHEYVGVPTSGNSLLSSLGRHIITLPETIDRTHRMSPRLARLLRISESETRQGGLSADGVILRAASILGAVKYCDARPGFFYRIHGGNKYATGSRLGHSYLRYLRKRVFLSVARDHFVLHERPTAGALRDEITHRSFGLRLRRRVHIRTRYLLAALTSRGTPRQKAGAMAAAIGVTRRQDSHRGAPKATPTRSREDAPDTRKSTAEWDTAKRD